MAFMFYGPWSMTLTGRGPRIRVTVSGSDDADGEYFASTHPVPVEVNGAEWQVQLDRSLTGTGDWKPVITDRVSAFDPVAGLTMRIDYDFLALSDASLHPTAFDNRLRAVFVSRDPDLAPVPAPDPPDFTVPGEN